MTDKQTEALKLALEALNSFPTKHLTPFIISARTAILEALASEASEDSSGTEQREHLPTRRAVERELERLANHTGMHLNDGKERVTLPGGTLRRMLNLIDRASPPAQRKPLTEEEIAEIAAQGHQRWLDYARAIEAAHGIKEKNSD